MLTPKVFAVSDPRNRASAFR